MPRLEDKKTPRELHEENTNSEAEKRREDIDPPDTSKKEDGVTPSFSAATNKDQSGHQGDSDVDKVVN